MMKVIILVSIMAALFFTGCGDGRYEAPGRRARDFVTELSNENFTRALAQGSSVFRTHNSLRDLQDLWFTTQMQAGSLNSIAAVEVSYENGLFISTVTADHNNRTVVWTLTYGAGETPMLYDARVSVNFRPAPRPANLPRNIIEEIVVVGEGSGYPLDARLTLPRNIPEGTLLPAVVLVHSHGPWDMDASVFNNKPFRDIAWHLAQNGIAVLRYDKITYRYPRELYGFFGNQVGFELETVFDAGWARHLLREDGRIDQGRVYVLGHGFGGSVAPLIAEKYGFSGWISMAGTPRTLIELAADAQIFAATRDGRGPSYIEHLISNHVQAADIFARLYTMDAAAAAGLEIMGMNGYLLRSMVLNPPVYSLRNNLPALILQGMNDFEVFFDRDFELFRDFLAHNENAEFRIYEGVNHMFMWSTMEQPDIRDYMPPAAVEISVLNDITEWIQRN